MTCRSWPSPVETWQYLIGLLKPASSSMSRTSATTTPEMSCPAGSRLSTSRPQAVSRLDISATPASSSGDSSMAAYSSSQDSGSRITPPFRTRG
jgi:hypothetical protein